MISNCEDYLIIGAGHQGLAMAAHFSLNGEKVNVWNRTLSHIDDLFTTKKIICRGIIKGTALIEKVSTKIDEVLTNTIYITTPSTAYNDIAKMLAPILLPNSVIFLNPGRTFGAIEFMEALKAFKCNNIPTIVETQSIVYTCRRTERNEAFIYALKTNIKMAYIGRLASQALIRKRIPTCIRNSFIFADTVLDTSFGNVGMILHCAPVLMNIGWIENNKHQFRYYYDGITPSISEYLQKMDEERIAVAKSTGINTASLIDWFYDCYGIIGTSIYDCIQKNTYYTEIDAPKALDHRYIFEDIPNGLVPIEYLGKEMDVNVAHISLIIDLACEVLGVDFRKAGRQYNSNTIFYYAGYKHCH